TGGGDNNGDTIGSVAVDFSAFGGGAAVAASNSSGTWTATFLITEDGGGSIDGTNLNVTVTATDNAGNGTVTSDTSNATLDNDSPTVTDGNISISGATGLGGAYKVGDTVTATWNNTGGGDNNGDTIGSVAVDFSAFGGGAAVAASNSSGTWTATFLITEDGGGSIDGTNLNVSMTATDNAGNTTTTGDTSNATVDNDSPVLSSSTPTDNATGVSLTDNIVINFSDVGDNIALGTGNIVITDGSQTITIDVASHGGQLSVSGNTLTINPTADLANSSANYNVQIAATAIDDDAGNSFSGIADTTTLDFTTVAAVDTSIVVFDLIAGTSSSHNGGSGGARTFDAGVSYDIYIKVDSTSHVVTMTSPWSGASNLGSDDTIYLVGNGSALIGADGNPMSAQNISSGLISWGPVNAVAFMGRSGNFTRFHTGGVDTAGNDMYATGSHGTNVLLGAAATTLPNSIAVSQILS
ncbi:MAG: Ig-like domain-containing protein, partial [Pseudomonadales bacterium]|nr:Ig-like domain-containing protein [Pseudomonadales bacterium]